MRRLVFSILLVVSLPGCGSANRKDCYDSSRTLLLNRGGTPPIGPGYC
jgi:hypothetical protein